MPTLPGQTAAPPGTPAWWKKHKKKAMFDPEAGYRVEGVDGYFDEMGNPINARAAKVIAKDDGGGLLGDVKFKEKVDGLKETVGLGPDQQAANLAYAVGEDEFKFQRYAEAAKKYKEAAASWPDSQLEQDAWFQQAESQFFANQYSAAEKTYEKLVRKYPNSPHLDQIIARQFTLGRYWDEYNRFNPNWPLTPNFIDNRRPLFDTVGRAMKNYDNIRLNDPTGPLADDAVMASANSYFLRGRYIDADEQYDLLRKEYPRSDHQFDAHVLGLQCKLRRYQGPEYDETPLKEALALSKQIKAQFAGKLDEVQRGQLAQIEAQARRELAQRDFNMGKYYDDLEEFGSAKFYYAKVLKDHGTTPLAEGARTRLAALTDKPDRPTSLIEPALKYVPQNAERKAIAQVPLITPSDGTRIPELDQGPQIADKQGAAGGDAATRR